MGFGNGLRRAAVLCPEPGLLRQLLHVIRVAVRQVRNAFGSSSFNLLPGAAEAFFQEGNPVCFADFF